MGLNDEAEKLRQAGEWLKGDPHSEKFRAAWAHVMHVVSSTQDLALYAEAQRLADEVVTQHGYAPVARPA